MIATTALQVGMLLSLLPIPVVTLPDSRSNLAPRNIPARNGNASAASDLYGLGMRLGAYLQVFGMLLYCLGSHHRSRTGIKLLSAAVCLSFLSSWTAFAARRDISPCEAWLVLSLVNAYGTPRNAAVKHWKKKDGGGVGFTISLVSVVWESVAFTWFFSTLVRQLPLLGTNNRVWLFASVDVSGWFRILMLIYSSLCCSMLFFQVPEYLCLIQEAFSVWAGLIENRRGEDAPSIGLTPPLPVTLWGGLMRKVAGWFGNMVDNRVFNKLNQWNLKFYLGLYGIPDNDINADEEARRWNRVRINMRRLWVRLYKVPEDGPMDSNEEQRRWTKGQIIVRKFWVAWGLFVLVITIGGVEKVITYNGLSPQNDLSQPGQMIPLILGVIALVEGTASAFMPTSPGKLRAVPSNVLSNSNLEMEAEEQDEGDESAEWILLRTSLKARVQASNRTGEEGEN